MLPAIAYVDDFESAPDTYDSIISQTKTFNINMNTNTIEGMVDGIEALKQSIYLMLSIEADQHIIYPWKYGLKTLDLIGKPKYYIMAVLPERLRNTLMSDNRIIDVTDFEFETYKNKMAVKFIVKTIYGTNIQEEMVVNY